uniref:Lig_chan-Glu_bd domain-containing protein n=1 Tax=Toxocara canis TaxID=6265 RepID=A0A183UX66_TOXCA
LEMMRMAEFWLNSRTQNAFDVVLGVRHLPPMQHSTLFWHLSDFICEELKLGFMVMLAGTTPNSFGVYSSIAKRMKVPLIDWEISDGHEGESLFSVSVRPLADEILIDYIQLKNWHNIIYFHDGSNAERSLSAMYEYLERKSPTYLLEIDTYRIPEDEEYFREFLNMFHRKNSQPLVNESADSAQRPLNIVVDICSSYRIRSFLKALEDSILIKKQYNYVISNFEMDDSDIDAFHYSLINITGFRLFDKHNKRYRHHQLYNDGYPGLYCRPIEDREHHNRPFEPFEFGDKILDALKQALSLWIKINFVILDEKDGTFTGRIQFDKEKLVRTNFSATVIEIKPGRTSLNSIKEVKPFVMLKRTAPGEKPRQGNDRFEGYCIDLLKLLANNLTGFDYEVFISDGNKYGARQEDGSWDGMIGYLLNEVRFKLFRSFIRSP